MPRKISAPTDRRAPLPRHHGSHLGRAPAPSSPSRGAETTGPASCIVLSEEEREPTLRAPVGRLPVPDRCTPTRPAPAAAASSRARCGERAVSAFANRPATPRSDGLMSRGASGAHQPPNDAGGPRRHAGEPTVRAERRGWHAGCCRRWAQQTTGSRKLAPVSIPRGSSSCL